jgi:hypothetical protein
VLDPREVIAPYPGLRPFEPHEAPIFFGRNEHVGRLLEILGRERFIAVIGPSGCGKSSLVRAGMLPALAGGWLGTGSDWRMAILRPGDRPIRQLARALMAPSALGPELVREETSPAAAGDPDASAPLEAELRRGPLGLVQLVEDARREGPSRTFDLLVLADQFEEIFRFARRGAREADEADAFVDLLLEARAAPSARIYVALAMRSDFLGHCAAFLDLPEAINRAQYLTPRLSREQLAAAISEPAHVFKGGVEAGLVNHLINAVSRDPDQLPILQHALARMWEAAQARGAAAPVVSLADLADVGGVEGALSGHAEAVLGELREEQKALAEGLFRVITERGSDAFGRDTRRAQKLGDIAKASGTRWKALVPVVDAFSREGVNFLTYVPPLNMGSLIDMSHEALIRQWPRLQAWVADEFERANDYRRWRDRGRDRAEGGELLVGADLARAREWLRGGAQVVGPPVPPSPRTAKADGAAPWMPTAEWAMRYALGQGAEATAEFESTVSFIEESGARERERKEAAERAEAEVQERERRRLEDAARDAQARAEAERRRAVAERKQVLLARKRIRDLEKVIAVVPDETKRQELMKKYLPQSVKRLSKGQQKDLTAKLKSKRAPGARPRVPAQHGLKLWEIGTTLRVRFLGGTPVQHKSVKAAASEWTQHANLRFKFVSKGPAEVRVAFEPNGGSWAYLGTDALGIPRDQATMNLGWVAENVLHEFGHVLGLIHETNNPNAKLNWNKPVVYRELQGPPNHWSKAVIDNVLFTKYKGVEYREFDPESIMSYSHPATWFLDGRMIVGGKVLSKSDKEFAAKLYPRT